MTIERRNLLLGGLGVTAATLGAGLGLGVPHAAAENAIEKQGGGSPTGSDWMGSIDGSIPLAGLTIPGTHDTCALRNLPFVQCQTYGPAAQLAMGVRFFDLRPSDSPGMQIFHGPVDVEHSLFDVLTTCRKFLTAHPSETIMVLIKQEHTDSDASTFGVRWKKTTRSFPDILYTSSHLPSLGKARGKVVVITRAAGVPGVAWSKAVVSDDYEVNSAEDARDSKWPTVRKALEKASTASRYTLHATFCSGTGAPRPWADPGDINDVIDPLLRTWLNKRTTRNGEHLGVVLVDFATKEKIEQIAARNFGRNSF